MIVSVGVLTALAVFLFLVMRRGRDANATQISDATWDTALATNNQVERLLVQAARPVSRSVAVNPQSNIYRSLETKLAASGGGIFAGSVEIFLSVQVAALIIAAGILAALPLFGLAGVPLFAASAASLVIALWPYNHVHEIGKKRLAAVREELPQFAELLLMPVASGSSVVPALSFTAARMEGVVASEVKQMLALLDTRAASTAELFEEVGRRLAAPAALAFFTSLHQSFTEGVEIADVIRSQAIQLRHQEHQRKRAELKKLPTKLVFITALHLLPFLFIVTVLPSFHAMGSM